MASGKQTPRQKMINLMYLVFIAMLALNMSKEVLGAFGMMKEKLTVSNTATTERNTAFMAGLAQKATEQPEKYTPLQKKAAEINVLSDELTKYIQGLKDGATQKIEDKSDYESMDRADYFDELFYKGGVIQPTGKEFVKKINDYRTQVLAILGDDFQKVAAGVKNEFQTGDEKGNVKTRENVKKEWLNYHYVGYPLIASLTKLTQMQADVKSTQSEVLSAMLQGQLSSEVSLTNYQAIVIPEKTAFFSGEPFKGKVVLGRFDNTMSFENVIINGNKISAENVVGGQVVLDFPAGNVGQQEIVGELQYMENDSLKSIPVTSSYTVIPKPNAAVISADKMNVVYRGVQNPMTISVPGATSVSANAAGLRQASGGAGKYTMDVTNVKAREVNIKVSAKLPGGVDFSDSKTFRIKEIPRPSGTVRGQMMEAGPIEMQRAGLAKSTVSAAIPGFDFDLKLAISGFSIRVEGERTIVVNGQQLNQAAKSVLQGAKRGASVQIFDIKAKIAGNSSYRLPPVSPIFIELKD